MFEGGLVGWVVSVRYRVLIKDFFLGLLLCVFGRIESGVFWFTRSFSRSSVFFIGVSISFFGFVRFIGFCIRIF